MTYMFRLIFFLRHAFLPPPAFLPLGPRSSFLAVLTLACPVPAQDHTILFSVSGRKVTPPITNWGLEHPGPVSTTERGLNLHGNHNCEHCHVGALYDSRPDQQ